MKNQNDQWEKCKRAESQQYRYRVLTGSIGLEGPWGEWIDGKPEKELMNRQYEYRRPKPIEKSLDEELGKTFEKLVDQSVLERKNNCQKLKHNVNSNIENLLPYDNKALCELINAIDEILYPNNIIKSFKKWEDFLFENEEKFLKRFCQNASELDKFSWNSENMHFTYVLDSGQHIGDSIKLKEWFDFLKGA